MYGDGGRLWHGKPVAETMLYRGSTRDDRLRVHVGHHLRQHSQIGLDGVVCNPLHSACWVHTGLTTSFVSVYSVHLKACVLGAVKGH